MSEHHAMLRLLMGCMDETTLQAYTESKKKVEAVQNFEQLQDNALRLRRELVNMVIKPSIIIPDIDLR